MNLTTAEKFLLLAQHPHKGRFLISGLYINYGITGALLLDLSLGERIDIKDSKLVLTGQKRSSDPLVAEVASLLQLHEQPLSIRRAVNKVSRRSGRLKKMLLKQLKVKGYLRTEEKAFLGFIRYQKHYLANHRARKNLVDELKNSLMQSGEISSEDAVVLGLVEATHMHRVFTDNKEELKTIKKQLHEKLKENPVADAVEKTIRQVQAALFAAIFASTVAARR